MCFHKLTLKLKDYFLEENVLEIFGVGKDSQFFISKRMHEKEHGLPCEAKSLKPLEKILTISLNYFSHGKPFVEKSRGQVNIFKKYFSSDCQISS
jgi:hypothetical protein